MPGSYVELGIQTLNQVESRRHYTAQGQGLVFDRQLQYTKGVLESVPEEHLVEHGNVHRELYRVIVATNALLDSTTAWSIETHEYFMENLFDLQWWTCVVALQVGKGQLLDHQTYLSLQVQLEELIATQLRDADYILKKEPHAWVTNLARRETPWRMQRHLPSYNLQALLIQREGSFTRRLMFPWDKLVTEDVEVDVDPAVVENQNSLSLSSFPSVPCFGGELSGIGRDPMEILNSVNVHSIAEDHEPEYSAPVCDNLQGTSSQTYHDDSGWQEGSSAVHDKSVSSQICEHPKSNYKGVRYRHKKWITEIRPSKGIRTVWLGTYKTEEEAASAHDAGMFYFKKSASDFNFPESLEYLMAHPLNKSLDEKPKLNFIKTHARLIAKDRLLRRMGKQPTAAAAACLPDPKHRMVSEERIKSVRNEKCELDLDMVLTEIRDRDARVSHVGVFNMVAVDIFRATQRGSPNQDHITIDLFQDMLGVSDKGWVIRTQYFGEECAMKRLDISTTELNDGTNVQPPDLARLWHPHIVNLMDYWTEESYLFLVMELMDGDLAELIANKSRTGSDKTKSPFSLVEAVDIMLQIAKGMVYMHDMGVAHPHIKCASVLLKADTTRNLNQIDHYYVVKLGGFGNSMQCDPEDRSRDVYLFGLTCLDILTGNVQSEDSIQHHIPERTPPTMRFCIENCLSAALTFSEVVILLLLTQLQMLEGKEDEESHRNKSLAKSNILLGGKLFRTELRSIPITTIRVMCIRYVGLSWAVPTP